VTAQTKNPYISPDLDQGKLDSRRLNDLGKDLAQGTNRNYTFKDNFRAQWISLEFRAPVTQSLRMLTRFTVRPMEVVLNQVATILPVYQALSVTETFRWTWDNGYVVTDLFNGLTGNETYVLTLLVIAE
jgi:hypothetical protein